VDEGAGNANSHDLGLWPRRLRLTFPTRAHRNARGALDFALKVNLPGYFYAHLTRAESYGQLGLHEPAQKALNEMLALRPDMARAAREELAKWWDSDLVEHIVDGLRRAGLKIEDRDAAGESLCRA